MLDLNPSCGEACKAELDAEFGEGNCIFIPCDVSNGDALKGKDEWERSFQALLTSSQLNRKWLRLEKQPTPLLSRRSRTEVFVVIHSENVIG